MFTFESRILWAHSSMNRDYLKLPKSGFFCGFFVCFCFFFSCSMWTVSCDMENLVHWPGIEPRPPSWEHSLSHLVLVLGKSQWNCLRVIKDNKFPKYLFCRISHAALFGKKKKWAIYACAETLRLAHPYINNQWLDAAVGTLKRSLLRQPEIDFPTTSAATHHEALQWRFFWSRAMTCNLKYHFISTS